ncbi:MAG: amidohydrolase family protein [Firmicutes bacterium]|nr:amidohydrolase family protein [Bacillota bacterium]
MYDVLIKNGRYPDYQTMEFVSADIAISDGKIIEIGKIDGEAKTVIDATGRIVSPGFIDIHMHEEYFVRDGLSYEVANYMLQMGVTTCMGGNCGSTHTPVKEFKKAIEQMGGAPVNYMIQTGYNTIRDGMGIDRYQPANGEQISIIAKQVQEDLLAGAYGISFGLEYDPGITFDEVMTVLNTQPQENLYVSAHYRDDSTGAIDAIHEMIQIAKESGKRFQISHLSSCSAMGQMDEALEILNRAMAENPKLQYDTYPYTAFATRIGSAVFDEGCFEKWGKSYENVWLTSGKYMNQFCTKEIFEEVRRDDPDVRAVAFMMNDDEIAKAIANPIGCMIGSDGGVNRGTGHPRAAGTFPRVLGKYVREDNVLPLIEALYKMTKVTADRLELYKKGRIEVGCDADITIFDPDTIMDGATFENLNIKPVGIDAVIVNGRLAMKDNVQIDGRAGRFIPGPYMEE